MEQQFDRSVSKVEVTGFEARNYDLLMNLITAGTYPFFIRRAVRDMHVRPDDGILVFGSGSGRNVCLVTRYLSERGRVLGLDIGDEMLSQARRRCRRLTNVAFEKQRVEEPLPYEGEFDKVFISFVLHGFIQEDRLRIIANARRALRPGGEFIILDYAHFDPVKSPWPVRVAFKMECPLATDFALRDWETLLREQGLDQFRTHHYYLGYVRLLAARKAGG